MSGGISGAGGAHVRTSGVGGVDAAAGGGAADAAAESVDPATGVVRTRPRSLDAAGIGLAASLHASFEASASTTPAAAATPRHTPTTPDELKKHIDSLPRAADGGGFYFDEISKMLKGRVTTDETDKILGELELTPPEFWLATVDKMKATPSDEPGLSLLDKFVKYGVNDRNKFIARFADMANKKLGLGLPTVEDRAKAHEADGMRHGRATRVARREVRNDSDLILDFYKAKDKMGFVNGLRAAGEETAMAAGAVVMSPFILISVLILGKAEL